MPLRLWPGQLGWRHALLDGHVVEPAAVRITWRPVELGDVGLDVDDRRSVDDVDSGEADRGAGDAEDLDQAEPDRVDPPRRAGGEKTYPASLPAKQERHPAHVWLVSRIIGLVQPGQHPCVVEVSQPVEPAGVGVAKLDPGVFGAVDRRLDWRGLELGVAGPNDADHL